MNHRDIHIHTFTHTPHGGNRTGAVSDLRLQKISKRVRKSTSVQHAYSELEAHVAGAARRMVVATHVVRQFLSQSVYSYMSRSAPRAHHARGRLKDESTYADVAPRETLRVLPSYESCAG